MWLSVRVLAQNTKVLDLIHSTEEKKKPVPKPWETEAEDSNFKPRLRNIATL